MRDLAAEARLDVARLDAARRVVTVRHELHLVLAVAELLDDLHEHADVLQAGDLESHEREDDVGRVEHRDDLLAVRRPRVHDDVGVALPEDLKHVLDVRAGDELGRLGRRRREEHLDAGRVLHEDRFDDVGVGLLERADEIGDRLRLGAHVQDDGDVAERQAAVDEDDRLLGGLMEGDREIRRDRGAPDAALR